MVCNNQAFILDFDWADESANFPLYPCDLNHNIIWPEGAKLGKVMKQEHDREFLHQHLELFQ